MPKAGQGVSGVFLCLHIQVVRCCIIGSQILNHVEDLYATPALTARDLINAWKLVCWL